MPYIKNAVLYSECPDVFVGLLAVIHHLFRICIIAALKGDFSSFIVHWRNHYHIPGVELNIRECIRRKKDK